MQHTPLTFFLKQQKENHHKMQPKNLRALRFTFCSPLKWTPCMVRVNFKRIWEKAEQNGEQYFLCFEKERENREQESYFLISQSACLQLRWGWRNNTPPPKSILVSSFFFLLNHYYYFFLCPGSHLILPPEKVISELVCSIMQSVFDKRSILKYCDQTGNLLCSHEY